MMGESQVLLSAFTKRLEVVAGRAFAELVKMHADVAKLYLRLTD